MSEPYHVRLAISQYGEQFRAELFTEDLGDTEGDLLTELPPSLAEWVPYLAQGADLPPDAARQVGKDLFAALLGQPENAKKWSEILAQSERKGQPIRLLIDATTEAVRDLPYGLMCEPHDDWFLFRGGKKQSVAFVRILRRCSPRPLTFGQRLRVLLAVAEPRSADVPAFGAAGEMKTLCDALRKDVEVFLCGPDGPRPLAEVFAGAAEASAFAPFVTSTREMLRKSLAGTFDVFHLLAHGYGAGVLLCNPDGTPAETTASELAEWCSAGRTSLAFLQVCKAGQTAGRGGFGGVAQQLLNPRGGNLAAVVASTFPLDAEHSTQAAVGFYRQLAAGRPPEESLTADRPETDWCWAFLELWARPGALGGTQQRAAFQYVSPYRGLSSFSEQDADLFFGRRAEVAELLQILRTDPAVAVVGDSGSGKSSLLQAGLVHAIRREGLAGSDRWRIVSLRPGYRPAQALVAALSPGSNQEPTSEVLRTALRVTAQPLMVVFDQFEEVFTLARDQSEVQVLTTALAEAVDGQRDRFRLVIGMRSEFLGQAASVSGLSQLIRRPWVLRPPSADDLRDIVAGPAEHCGYTFQGPIADGDPRHAVGLLDRILADPLLARDATGGGAAPLPLLQFALERLWLKAVEKCVIEFAHAEFDEIGGMGKAIAQHAEAVFQSAPTTTGLGAAARPLAEQIITALVNTHGMRQPRLRDALQAETGNPDAARTILDYLVGERLLTVRSDPEDLTKSLIDLSHEALIQNWDRLRGWLAEDPQGRAMREEFRKAAEQWEAGTAGGKPRSRFGLPGSDVARHYLAWVDTSRPKLSPVQREFADALRDMLARQRRLRRLVMGSLAGLTLAASLLAIVSHRLMREANESAEQAKQSEAAARTSADKARDEERVSRTRAAYLTLTEGIKYCEEGRLHLGMLVIAASLKLCPTDGPDGPELRRVIRTNLAGWAPQLMCLDEVRQFDGPAVTASDDGEVALIEVGDDSVRLVDTQTGRPLGPPFPARRQTGAWGHVRRNGSEWLVLTYGSESAQLWNGTTGQPVGPVIAVTATAGSEQAYDITVADLSPDHRTIATGLNNGEVWLWDGRSGKPAGSPLRHEGKVNDLRFTADGKALLTGCNRTPGRPLLIDTPAEKAGPAPEKAAGLARLWNLAGAKVVWWQWYADPVTFVGVSPDPDGRFLVVGGFNVVVWDRTLHNYVGSRIRNSEPGVWGVFDPAEDGTVLIARPSGHVDIHRMLQQRQFVGERLSPQGWITAVGFKPKDRTVFTLNGDGTVRIWRRPLRTDAEREYLHPDAVLAVAFGPASETLATACRDGSVSLWATDDTTRPVKRFEPPPRPDGQPPWPMSQVHISDDGTRLIAQNLYLQAFVWELTNGRPVTPPDGESLAAAAEDGVTILTRLKDRTYRVRNLRTGTAGKPFVIPGGLGPNPESTDDDAYLLRVNRVAFSPSRGLVAVITFQGTAQMHRADSGELVGPPIVHQVGGRPEGIRALQFSPDGARLLSQSDHAQGIWLTAAAEEEHLLVNPVGIQLSRFSRCGRLVMTATNFELAKLWDVEKKQPRLYALVHSSQVWGMAVNDALDRVATASYDRTARVWDGATGVPVSPPLLHGEGVSDVKYAHDGKHFLTGSWDRRARLWTAIEPVPDDVELIDAWVETMTGMHFGATNTPELLTAEEWNKRKKRLDQLGGPPWTHVRPAEVKP